MNLSGRYLLISPCRDEAQYLRRTLDSVAAQPVMPALWGLVGDGSTDETPAILKEYARRFPNPRVVRRTAGAPPNHSEVKDERAPTAELADHLTPVYWVPLSEGRRQ